MEGNEKEGSSEDINQSRVPNNLNVFIHLYLILCAFFPLKIMNRV